METGEVGMREIGGQDEDWKLMPIVRRRNLGKKIEEEQREGGSRHNDRIYSVLFTV